MKREWKAQNDSGAVHALGNGRIIVYEVGPQITHIVGYPYSAEPSGEITIEGITHCQTVRRPATDIYDHLLDDGTVITDVTDCRETAFLRRIRGEHEITMVFHTGHGFVAEQKEDALFLSSPDGTMFHIYHTDYVVKQYLAVSGNVTVTQLDEKNWAFRIHGNGCLYIANDMETMERIKKESFEAVIERTASYWQEFLKRGKKLPGRLGELCESVAILIKCQQGEDGAVTAGYPYRLAYVRDQYGVMRGLLKMGYVKEAEMILQNYKLIFDKFGTIHNAHSIGEYGVFHIHENDKAEITGYLSVVPFDIYAYNQDPAFLEEMLPLVRWAIEQQIGELKNNMVPFNGDETYIAGGFLPRSAMYDGSAEATMLLHEGIRRYQEYTGDMQYQQVYEAISETYKENFVIDGRFVTNNPKRLKPEEYPAGRHGVCENCTAILVDLYKVDGERYVCKKCVDTHKLPPNEHRIYELASSKLSQAYVSSNLIDADMMYGFLDEMVEMYHKTKEMPSGCPGGECVGYDYGMLLYALVKYNHPAAREFCELAVSVVDECDCWCEYYKNGVPYNTRFRPWESAINMEAIISFYEKNPGK